MKKLYHLIMVESKYKLKNSESNRRSVLSNTLWVDIDKAVERAQTMVHNEYLNDQLEYSTHRCEVKNITKDMLINGIVFIAGHNIQDYEDVVASTEFTGKSIFLVEEKSLLLRILANLCNKTNPNFINGYDCSKTTF